MQKKLQKINNLSLSFTNEPGTIQNKNSFGNDTNPPKDLKP